MYYLLSLCLVALHEQHLDAVAAAATTVAIFGTIFAAMFAYILRMLQTEIYHLHLLLRLPSWAHVTSKPVFLRQSFTYIHEKGSFKSLLHQPHPTHPKKFNKISFHPHLPLGTFCAVVKRVSILLNSKQSLLRVHTRTWKNQGKIWHKNIFITVEPPGSELGYSEFAPPDAQFSAQKWMHRYCTVVICNG